MKILSKIKRRTNEDELPRRGEYVEMELYDTERNPLEIPSGGGGEVFGSAIGPFSLIHCELYDTEASGTRLITEEVTFEHPTTILVNMHFKWYATPITAGTARINTKLKDASGYDVLSWSQDVVANAAMNDGSTLKDLTTSLSIHYVIVPPGDYTWIMSAGGDPTHPIPDYFIGNAIIFGMKMVGDPNT